MICHPKSKLEKEKENKTKQDNKTTKKHKNAAELPFYFIAENIT